MKLQFEFVHKGWLSSRCSFSIQAQLKKIGIKLTPRYVDHAAIESRFSSVGSMT